MSLLLSWQPGNGVDELQVSVLIFRSWIGVNFVKYVLTLCRRTDEGSRRKCGQYWPLEEGGQEVYGHIAVVNQRVDRHSHYNHTTLELHNTEVRKNILLNVAAKKSGIAWKAPVTEWDWYPHHILCIPQNVQSTPLPVERFSTSRMHFLSYIFSIIKRITCKILFVFSDMWTETSESFPVPQLARLWRPHLSSDSDWLPGSCEETTEKNGQGSGISVDRPPAGTANGGPL